MVWHQPSQQPQFTDNLDFTQIVFKRINACCEDNQVPGQFFFRVQRLSDLLVPYWDEEFDKEMAAKKLVPNLSNPYFKEVNANEKDDHARGVFRALVKLVHRAGFLPEKRIEGLLDEKTILAFWADTGQL